MTIKPGHPKIWLDPARLQWLRANPKRLEWTRLLTNCEDDLHRDASGLPLTYTSALNHALVYQVTGNTKTVPMAVKLIEQYIAMGVQDAMTKVGATGPHGFGARIVIPECAVAYDWLYPTLPAATKRRWADFIMGCCDYSWLETNPTKGIPPRTTPSTEGQTQAGNNFYAGFLMSLIAAIVLNGEHPRAQVHLDLGMKKLHALEEYLWEYGSGGVSLEGTNYGTWIRHAWLHAALLTATDKPSAMLAGLMGDAAGSRWQLTIPDRKHKAPYGGQPQGPDAPITEDDTAASLVALSSGDPTTRAIAKSWLDSITYTRKKQNSWMPALWYRNDMVALDVHKLPLSAHAPGSGFVSMRSSWERDANYVYFVCGPVRESHQEYAAGTFGIWAGEWLTGPARLWGLGGEMLPSEYHNVILVKRGETILGQPGQVQQQALPKDSMRITSFTGNQVEGDASRAYDYYKNAKVWPVLDSWTRRVVFAGNRVTVVDRIVKLNPADEIIWQLQCKSQPIISFDGSNYAIFGQQSRLNGHCIVDVAGSKTIAVPVMKGKAGALSSWTLQQKIPGGSQVVTITNEMEIVRSPPASGEGLASGYVQAEE